MQSEPPPQHRASAPGAGQAAASVAPPSPYCDASAIHRKLLARRSTLFSKKCDEVEVWALDDAAGVKKEPLRTAEASLADGVTGDVFYIIRQEHSWDRLMMATETFDKLTTALQVFPFFVSLALNFGLKVRDDYNTWHGFHSRRHLTTAEGGRRHANGGYRHETCYMLYFFEQNGRTDGNGWSPRQTAVYQTDQTASGGRLSSSWILIKPSPELEQSLEAELDRLRGLAVPADIQAIYLHVLIVSFALRNWSEYIATQRTKLEQHEAKACYSHVDHVHEFDFELRFSDRQDLQLLRQQLLRAGAMLDGTIDLQARIRGYLLGRSQDDSVSEAVRVELDDLDVETKYYRRCIDNLEQRASGTMSLQLDILNRRYGHANLRSATANESSLKSNVDLLAQMTSIASNAEKEREAEQKTAGNIRALTVVATLYLPASLLSGIFSSHLVDVDAAGSFIVSSEFWKFMVVLIPMILGTFGVSFLLQTVWNFKHRGTLRRQGPDLTTKDAGVLGP